MPMRLGAACNACNLTFSHRTGSYRITLSSDKEVYTIGRPVYLTITMTNLGKTAMRVDPARVTSQFTLHVVAPNFKVTEPDKAPPNKGPTSIAPGKGFTFPKKSLADWPIPALTHPGDYSLNMSF
jgi:hypothetical protein